MEKYDQVKMVKYLITRNEFNLRVNELNKVLLYRLDKIGYELKL